MNPSRTDSPAPRKRAGKGQKERDVSGSGIVVEQAADRGGWNERGWMLGMLIQPVAYRAAARLPGKRHHHGLLQCQPAGQVPVLRQVVRDRRAVRRQAERSVQQLPDLFIVIRVVAGGGYPITQCAGEIAVCRAQGTADVQCLTAASLRRRHAVQRVLRNRQIAAMDGQASGQQLIAGKQLRSQPSGLQQAVRAFSTGMVGAFFKLEIRPGSLQVKGGGFVRRGAGCPLHESRRSCGSLDRQAGDSGLDRCAGRAGVASSRMRINAGNGLSVRGFPLARWMCLLLRMTDRSDSSLEAGVLYVVATPIGHLDDISRRAVDVLSAVETIAAEDTRRTLSLLRAYALNAPKLVALHEHNELEVAADLVGRLQAGETVALVSDAGTPLLSDPGYHLVRCCFEAGVAVRPVPGPSAVVAAMSVCPLPLAGCRFEGFLPSRAGARRTALTTLLESGQPVVFFEAPHRLRDCLLALAVLAPERRVFVAREMTKRFETYLVDVPEKLVASRWTRRSSGAVRWSVFSKAPQTRRPTRRSSAG